MQVKGVAEREFEAVKEAFARNFADHEEVGAACCVYRDGVPVVDLWGRRETVLKPIEHAPLVEGNENADGEQNQSPRHNEYRRRNL